MIKVTRRHHEAYLLIWEKTEQGTKPWHGIVTADDAFDCRMRDALNSLKKKRAIDWRTLHNAREFVILAKPNQLEVIKDRAKTLRTDDPLTERRLLDRGEFLKAAQQAGLPPFEDQFNLAPTLKPYARPRPNPQARVLDAPPAPQAA